MENCNIEINFEDFAKFATAVETSSIDTENIQKVYAKGIEQTLKNDLEEKFNYKIENIDIIYDKKYENIEKINLKIKNNNIGDIEKIEIGNNNIKQENENFDDVKKYISENYNITNINIT